MDELGKIVNYLEIIYNYYSQLKGTDNFIAFLKREVQCVDECLDFIDLNILPICQNYIEECRFKQQEALKKDSFLEESKKLHKEIVTTIFTIKNYLAMSDQERAVYDSFINFFPIEIESQDLLIENFTDIVFDCHVKEEDFIKILYKHFQEIIENINNEKVFKNG
jgi:hypothetical protein